MTQADHVVEMSLGGKRRSPRLRVLRDPTWMPKPGIPNSRDECRDGERPCPYVRCKFHLWLTDGPREGLHQAGRTSPGKPRDIVPTTLEPRWLEDPTPPSCALDIAEARQAMQPIGPLSYKLVGHAMGLDIESVRQIALRAFRKLRVSGKTGGR